MKKFLIMCVISIILVLAVSMSFAADRRTLPDVEGWINGDIRTTVLDTVSGNKGLWLERDYRTAAGRQFHAVWVEGAGDSGWTPGDVPVSTDDGALGTGSTYRTLSVSGEKAILEHHPVTGRSLSVKVSKIGTLTIESKNAAEDEIINAAEVIIKKIR